jgi:hypothetical protein
VVETIIEKRGLSIMGSAGDRAGRDPGSLLTAPGVA